MQQEILAVNNDFVKGEDAELNDDVIMMLMQMIMMLMIMT
jgi:hypothetical protein